MGCNVSRKECEACGRMYGSIPVFEFYHHGELGGRCLCIHCFQGYLENKNYLTEKIKKNVKSKVATCTFCSYKNKNELSYRNIKVFWYGKYGNMIMCEKCLFNKTRRKNIF